VNPWLRGGLIVVALLVVVYLLFTVVFPWVEIRYVTDPVLGA